MIIPNKKANYKQIPTIARILANGIIRLNTKQLREARTRETKQTLIQYSKLVSSAGLLEINEQEYLNR